MPRNEEDKEDLIAEATALQHRAEYRVAPDSVLKCTLLTVGFRKDESLSLYFDQDPFYQFDSVNRLRRGYLAGLLYRAQRGTLSELRRERTPDQTTLARRDLTTEQTNEFRHEMVRSLTDLQTAIDNHEVTLIRSVPADHCLLHRVRERVNAILSLGNTFLSESIRTRL